MKGMSTPESQHDVALLARLQADRADVGEGVGERARGRTQRAQLLRVKWRRGLTRLRRRHKRGGVHGGILARLVSGELECEQPVEKLPTMQYVCSVLRAIEDEAPNNLSSRVVHARRPRRRRLDVHKPAAWHSTGMTGFVQ